MGQFIPGSQRHCPRALRLSSLVPRYTRLWTSPAARPEKSRTSTPETTGIGTINGPRSYYVADPPIQRQPLSCTRRPTSGNLTPLHLGSTNEHCLALPHQHRISPPDPHIPSRTGPAPDSHTILAPSQRQCLRRHHPSPRRRSYDRPSIHASSGHLLRSHTHPAGGRLSRRRRN